MLRRLVSECENASHIKDLAIFHTSRRVCDRGAAIFICPRFVQVKRELSPPEIRCCTSTNTHSLSTAMLTLSLMHMCQRYGHLRLIAPQPAPAVLVIQGMQAAAAPSVGAGQPLLSCCCRCRRRRRRCCCCCCCYIMCNTCSLMRCLILCACYVHAAAVCLVVLHKVSLAPKKRARRIDYGAV